MARASALILYSWARISATHACVRAPSQRKRAAEGGGGTRASRWGETEVRGSWVHRVYRFTSILLRVSMMAGVIHLPFTASNPTQLIRPTRALRKNGEGRKRIQSGTIESRDAVEQAVKRANENRSVGHALASAKCMGRPASWTIQLPLNGCCALFHPALDILKEIGPAICAVVQQVFLVASASLCTVCTYGLFHAQPVRRGIPGLLLMSSCIKSSATQSTNLFPRHMLQASAYTTSSDGGGTAASSSAAPPASSCFASALRSEQGACMARAVAPTCLELSKPSFFFLCTPVGARNVSVAYLQPWKPGGFLAHRT